MIDSQGFGRIGPATGCPDLTAAERMVIERVRARDEDTEAALMTCYMRGWVEPLHDSTPTGDLTPDMKLPQGPMFSRAQAVFRLTEGGWSALKRAYAWAVADIVIAEEANPHVMRRIAELRAKLAQAACVSSPGT